MTWAWLTIEPGMGQERIEGGRMYGEASTALLGVWVATTATTGRKRRLELFSLGASRNTVLHRRDL